MPEPPKSPFRFTCITATKCEQDRVPYARGEGVPPPAKCRTPASLWCPECELHFCAAHGGNHGHAGGKPASHIDSLDTVGAMQSRAATKVAPAPKAATSESDHADSK